jgi:hypothetical protein
MIALKEALVKLTPDDDALVPVIVPSAFCVIVIVTAAMVFSPDLTHLTH